MKRSDWIRNRVPEDIKEKKTKNTIRLSLANLTSEVEEGDVEYLYKNLGDRKATEAYMSQIFQGKGSKSMIPNNWL